MTVDAVTINRVTDLLLWRRSLVAAKLTEPGPSPEELDVILRCATRVPDHGKLTPWRIQVVQGEARGRLGRQPPRRRRRWRLSDAHTPS